MNPVLLRIMEIAAANKTLNEDVSVEEQFPDMVATLLRYENLLKRQENSIINDHISGLTKADLIKCKSIYTKDYFLALQLSYEGIRRLCSELIHYSKIFKVDPSQAWLDYADGVFDWISDIEDLQLES